MKIVGCHLEHRAQDVVLNIDTERIIFPLCNTQERVERVIRAEIDVYT